MTIYVQVMGLALVLVLQAMFPDIAFEAVGASIQMFFLYFNIENPDIKNVRELETIKNEIYPRIKISFLFPFAMFGIVSAQLSIANILYDKDPFGEVNTITLSLSISNMSKKAFSGMDLAISKTVTTPEVLSLALCRLAGPNSIKNRTPM